MTASGPEFEPRQDALKIEESVNRRRILGFWHYTPGTQLSSMLMHGKILLRQLLDEQHFSYNEDEYRWGTFGRAKMFEQYAAASITRPYGMLYKEDHPVLLYLEPRLLWRQGTLSCGRWSSHKDVTLESLLSASDCAAFDKMFDDELSPFPRPLPGEVLLWREIDVRDVQELAFFNREDFDFVAAIARGIQFPTRCCIARPK